MGSARRRTSEASLDKSAIARAPRISWKGAIAARASRVVTIRPCPRSPIMPHAAAAAKTLREIGARRARWDVREFDRKFGADFLAGVPAAPGVYRFHDERGVLLYVGTTANLRRRLGEYRLARRRKRDRKRRALVRRGAAITWEVCESALSAALLEIRLIQRLRPPMNVATAFPFLYPYIGICVEGRETYFCLTTRPEAFPAFAFHGVFRSRAVTREAFFSLMRRLSFARPPVPRPPPPRS